MPHMHARSYKQHDHRPRSHRVGSPIAPLVVKEPRKTRLQEMAELMTLHLWENPQGATRKELMAAAGARSEGTFTMALDAITNDGRAVSDGSRPARYFAA